jgi:hypothetical protein
LGRGGAGEFCGFGSNFVGFRGSVFTANRIVPAPFYLFPALSVIIPALSVIIPAQIWYIPAPFYLFPARRVAIPARRVAIPARRVAIPAGRVALPESENEGTDSSGIGGKGRRDSCPCRGKTAGGSAGIATGLSREGIGGGVSARIFETRPASSA